MSKSILIISCSAAKRHDPELLPAIQRYDGPVYRMLRKLKREGRLAEDLRILILSARYGLITADQLIIDYEQRMTVARAAALQDLVSLRLRDYFDRCQPRRLFINLGDVYRAAIPVWPLEMPLVDVTWANGGIGQRAAQLKAWILEDRP